MMSRDEARRYLMQQAEETAAELDRQFAKLQAETEQQMQQLASQPRSPRSQELIEQFMEGLTKNYRKHSQELLEQAKEDIRRRAREF